MESFAPTGSAQEANKGNAFRLGPCVIIQQPEWKTLFALQEEMTHILTLLKKERLFIVIYAIPLYRLY